MAEGSLAASKADQIKTPLLVAQGANDPRVNRREAEQIVVALRDHGSKVEYILAPDEGHGFVRPVNNMALFMAAEKFLAMQLDGRYQEGGTPEVVAQLKEISVDPKNGNAARVSERRQRDGAQAARDLHRVSTVTRSIWRWEHREAMTLTTTCDR